MQNLFRLIKKPFIAILSAVILVVSLLVMPSPTPVSALYCSDITKPLPAWITTAVENNKPFYLEVSNRTGVPWEMLAAIHYRETNFSHSNPLNGQGIFQFVNGEGGPYPAGPVSDPEFVRQLGFMASKIQSDYVFRGSLNYQKRALRQNEPDSFRVQDALFSYNGRASVYAQQAAQYGFNSSLSPYEGSPYVMNMFDCPRLSMGIITRDYGALDGKDGRFGAFTLYARLKSDSFWQSYPSWLGTSPTRDRLISSQAHPSYVGWMSPVQNNGIIGTTGQGKPIEAFLVNGDVEYSSYNGVSGWQPTVNRGMVSGSTGQNLPLQAIKIKPIDSLASRYDIYYRAHVSYVGWMEWTKNGQPAGVTGSQNGNLEAVEIQLVPVGWPAPPTTGIPFNDAGPVNYAPAVSISTSSHVSYIGWQPTVIDGMTSGLAGQNSIEAVKMNLSSPSGSVDGSLVYSAHVAYMGWQNYVSADQVSGTTGRNMPIEAMRISLVGKVADSHDVLYRTYVRGRGWMMWTKNNLPSGSVGASLSIAAIEARVVPKNVLAATSNNDSLYNPRNLPIPDTYNLTYSTHVSYVGWVGNIKPNQTGGTVGQSKAIESLRIDSLNSSFGGLSINCSSYPRGGDWIEAAQGSNCGTTGQGKALESLKLSLLGDAANKYDLYYKVHVSWTGWEDWVKNGEAAGTSGSGRNIEAIIIKLVEK